MIDQSSVQKLIKNYFPESTDKQVDEIMAELVRDIEVNVHAKIRELVNIEKMKGLKK